MRTRKPLLKLRGRFFAKLFPVMNGKEARASLRDADRWMDADQG
jgi:hypothetical protein